MDGLSCKNIWSSPHSPTFAQFQRTIFKSSRDKQMYLRKSAPRLGNFVEIIATPQYTKYKIQIYDTPIFEIHEVLLFQKGANLGYVIK